jgi:hypothetical protein
MLRRAALTGLIVVMGARRVEARHSDLGCRDSMVMVKEEEGGHIILRVRGRSAVRRILVLRSWRTYRVRRCLMLARDRARVRVRMLRQRGPRGQQRLRSRMDWAFSIPMLVPLGLGRCICRRRRNIPLRRHRGETAMIRQPPEIPMIGMVPKRQTSGHLSLLPRRRRTRSHDLDHRPADPQPVVTAGMVHPPTEPLNPPLPFRPLIVPYFKTRNVVLPSRATMIPLKETGS